MFGRGAKAQIDPREAAVLIATRFHGEEAQVDQPMFLKSERRLIEKIGDALRQFERLA